MAYLTCIGLFIAVLVCDVNSQSSSCSSGTCISILDCPELKSILDKKNRTPQEVKRLQDAQCGFQGSTPKVCCPEPCYNPDGKLGKCVNIYQCDHLAKMLKQPMSRPDNANYVLNSKCTGPDRFSVCCASPRNLLENLNLRCTGTVNAFPGDPSTNCCGRDSNTGNKISGGNATTVDQYPWMTLIEYTKDDGPIRTMCGGVLISTKYVLTAAHCVTGAILNFGTPRSVRLGEYNTANPGKDCTIDDCNDGAISIKIEEAIAHPEYSTRGKQSKHDIAMIRLIQAAPFTDFIRPICLPERDLTVNPPENFTLYAAGWGAVSKDQPYSTIKLQVDLPFVPIKECQKQYQVPERRAELWEGQICAGGEPGKDSCRGDSGGPLMYEVGKRIYEITGVVSFGPKPCGITGVPGVYTKVHHYMPWIRSLMRA